MGEFVRFDTNSSIFIQEIESYSAGALIGAPFHGSAKVLMGRRLCSLRLW